VNAAPFPSRCARNRDSGSFAVRCRSSPPARDHVHPPDVLPPRLRHGSIFSPRRITGQPALSLSISLDRAAGDILDVSSRGLSFGLISPPPHLQKSEPMPKFSYQDPSRWEGQRQVPPPDQEHVSVAKFGGKEMLRSTRRVLRSWRTRRCGTSPSSCAPPITRRSPRSCRPEASPTTAGWRWRCCATPRWPPTSSPVLPGHGDRDDRREEGQQV